MMGEIDASVSLYQRLFRKRLKIKIEHTNPYLEGKYVVVNNEFNDVVAQEYGVKSKFKLFIIKAGSHYLSVDIFLNRYFAMFLGLFFKKFRRYRKRDSNKPRNRKSYVHIEKKHIDMKIESGKNIVLNVPTKMFNDRDIKKKHRFYVIINGKKYYSKKYYDYATFNDVMNYGSS